MFYFATFASFSYTAFGTLFYCTSAGMTPGEALYFVVVTLTTVGYGDHCMFADCGRCEEGGEGECGEDDGEQGEGKTKWGGGAVQIFSSLNNDFLLLSFL